MMFRIPGILLFMSLMLVSCFEEDQRVAPYVPPDSVESVFIQNSIYTNQIYFDFSSGSIVAENENTEWVLGFECTESGFHIRINSSDLWGVSHTGSADMNADYSDSGEYSWLSDKSDGNPDSTAVGAWVRFDGEEAVYTNEVMLLGQYDGINYNASRKVQFIHVDEQSYTFLVDDLELTHPDTVKINKNERFNYVYYAIKDHEVKLLEPDKDSWDLLFTQYFTILFTDDGIPAPYYVRGALLNPNLVQSALDTITHFLDISTSNVQAYAFSSAQDVIGHDWKSVEVSESTNSAEYKVRPGYTYIVRDTERKLYKFRFKSFFNESGQKGYPSFEFSKLERAPGI